MISESRCHNPCPLALSCWWHRRCSLRRRSSFAWHLWGIPTRRAVQVAQVGQPPSSPVLVVLTRILLGGVIASGHGHVSQARSTVPFLIPGLVFWEWCSPLFLGSPDLRTSEAERCVWPPLSPLRKSLPGTEANTEVSNDVKWRETDRGRGDLQPCPQSEKLLRAFPAHGPINSLCPFIFP